MGAQAGPVSRIGQPALDRPADPQRESLVRYFGTGAGGRQPSKNDLPRTSWRGPYGDLRASNRFVPGILLHECSRKKSFGVSFRPIRFSRQPIHR